MRVERSLRRSAVQYRIGDRNGRFIQTKVPCLDSRFSSFRGHDARTRVANFSTPSCRRMDQSTFCSKLAVVVSCEPGDA